MDAGLLEEIENHTPYSSSQGGSVSVDHDASANDSILVNAGPFHDDTESDDPLPFLSVLNIVIDHCMMDPTPMEPSEFKTQQKVPVIRVYGPIVRGTCEHDQETWQSCCLFIHGAYPYLLARPTVAGPDGSSSAVAAGEGHVDWDSVQSVEAIVSRVQDTLENMIQESFEPSTSTIHNHERRTYKIIRSISVVVGRGFYTFCPGPAAPFLRVEYYDPKLRWKVKMMLERGLDLPNSFHPDPQQYDHHLSNKNNSAGGALTFHCYEAHIPYTMQFFKDWNLAGMSYIHLSPGGKFRKPLPKCHRSRTKMVSAKFSDDYFLHDNTDSNDIWEDWIPCNSITCNSPEENVLQQPSSVDDSSQGSKTIEQDPVWSKKETSCDLEFDCTVDQIMNIQTIITSKSDDDSILWRAVPSLREIWRQERRRMARLLQPRHDFLSQSTKPSSPPFTLNVKQGASEPGTRLAVKGMKNLVQVTLGLEHEFNRAMAQLVRRYAPQVRRIDSLLLAKKHSNRPLDEIAQTQDSSVPSDNDALEALAALRQQFGQEGEIHNNNLAHSQTRSQVPPPDEFEESSALFSQRVDRGENIDESQYEYVEDYIDPSTLVPFDDFEDDEEENMDEFEFEQALTMLENTMTRKTSEDAFIHPSLSKPKSADEMMAERSDESVSSENCKPDFSESTKDLVEEQFPIAVPPISSKSLTLMNTRGCVFGPSFLPPSRAQVESREISGINSLWLHPLDRHRPTPRWLIHSSHYISMRNELLALQLVRDSWGPRWHEGKFVITSVAKPPSRLEVESWMKRLAPKTRKVGHSQSYRNQTDNGTASKSSNPRLQIDANTRQLTLTQSSKKKRRIEFNEAVQEVEEVEWSSSQPISTQFESNSQLEAIPRQDVEFPHFSTSPNPAETLGSCSSPFTSSENNNNESQESAQALAGIGQQGGRIFVEGGGGLKSKTKASPKGPIQNTSQKSGISSLDLPNPLTIMSIEIHVQCRTGKAGVHDSKEIAMRPNPERDKVAAVVYVYARDPGGGESIRFLERGCLFVPIEAEVSGIALTAAKAVCLSRRMEASLPKATLGVVSDLCVEAVRDEKQLMLRLASIVRWKDPDMLVSWDSQGSGLGYIIERGVILGKSCDTPNKTASSIVDMARLLGRFPSIKKEKVENVNNVHDGSKTDVDSVFMNNSTVLDETVEIKYPWKGSGLGTEWDERVGPGVAAASVLIAEEVKHPNSSYLPAMVATVLGKRIPFHDDLRLTEWYAIDSGRERWRTLHHRLSQAVSSLLMLDELDVVGRAGEAARLSGVEFSQSFPGIRGSQYKVEGVLLRALKSIQSDERGNKKGKVRISGHHEQSHSSESESQTQSPWKLRRGIESKVEYVNLNQNASSRCYYFYSPGVIDTNNQEALECQALNLEPQSGILNDPVVVCDFTALYPSLVIAYNLCYSTIAGKLDYHSTRSEMRREGRTTGKIGPFLYPEGRTATVINHHVKSIMDDDDEKVRRDSLQEEKTCADRAYTAPTGSIYVSESILKGVLPQVLDEILSTRAMLKKAAQQYKKLVPNLSPAVLRQLEARQLALKYVANVTYGYTSATFSGRCAMPLLADTIVECGRRTLTNAMNLANEWGKDVRGRWHGAEVIYGDTDSLFVKLPGRSVDEAFEFGEELCNEVTASNPPPVQLKLEKVYLGSMMQTKKKYCGMKFESRTQKKPTFEAKGIETIRKDQCALTQKVLRNSLIALFRRGIDDVKAYLFRQWALIMGGNLPVSDFILTGRVRSKYRGGRVGPVQAALARRLCEADPGRVMREKERLAYVIVATPGVTFRLRDCVLTPMELLEQWDAFTIHSAYYITKHVNAALQRCLGLAPYHVNVNAWFEACPKPRRRVHHWPVTRTGSNVMISSYFGTDICSFCGRKCRAEGSSRAVVCATCRKDAVSSATIALYRLNQCQKESSALASQCSRCNGFFEDASTFAALKGRTFSGCSSMLRQAKTPPGIVTPIANCTCIDCPITFERHRLREAELEAHAICRSLDLI